MAHRNELSKLRREKWIAAIKRDDLTQKKLKNEQVCSRHFLTGKISDGYKMRCTFCFSRETKQSVLGQPAALEDVDHPDWIPTQNLGHESTVFKKKVETVARSERVQKRKERKLDEPTTSAVSSKILIVEDAVIVGGKTIFMQIINVFGHYVMVLNSFIAAFFISVH